MSRGNRTRRSRGRARGRNVPTADAGEGGWAGPGLRAVEYARPLASEAPPATPSVIVVRESSSGSHDKEDKKPEEDAHQWRRRARLGAAWAGILLVSGTLLKEPVTSFAGNFCRSHNRCGGEAAAEPDTIRSSIELPSKDDPEKMIGGIATYEIVEVAPDKDLHNLFIQVDMKLDEDKFEEIGGAFDKEGKPIFPRADDDPKTEDSPNAGKPYTMLDFLVAGSDEVAPHDSACAKDVGRIFDEVQDHYLALTGDDDMVPAEQVRYADNPYDIKAGDAKETVAPNAYVGFKNAAGEQVAILSCEIV
jgi:hypothetical protein